MSIVFMIGNGFDKNCGLKSSYKEVYEQYVLETSTNEVVAKFKKDIKGDIDSWGDFEMAMADYAKNFSSEDEFLLCVRDFKKFLNMYLVKEQTELFLSIGDKQIVDAIREEMLDSILNFYTGVTHSIDAKIQVRMKNVFAQTNVITFNYTDVFSHMLNWAVTGNFKPNVIHIHGKLGEDLTLGVDRIEQITANYECSNKIKRGFVKPFFNDAYDTERVQTALNCIEDANTICVFGMSLGDSDLTWRNKLIEWVENKKYAHLFIYRYSMSNIEGLTVDEKLDVEEAEKRRMLDEWGIELSEECFERIHIPCGKNIFNIARTIELVREGLMEIEEDVV